MSDADADTTDELRDLIARARQDGPAPPRLAAVRARLEAQLGPLDAPPTPPAPAVSAKATLGLVAVAAMIAIGVWLGTRSDDRSAVGTALDPQSDAPGATTRAPSPAPVLVPPLEEARSDAPVADAPSVQPAATEPAGGEEVHGPAPRVERQARRVTPAPEAVVPELIEDPASMLREEIALLDRALRARESGDPGRAVAALEEHRTRFPSGRLQPERDRMLGELATSGVATTP